MAAATELEFDSMLWSVLMDSFENHYWLSFPEQWGYYHTADHHGVETRIPDREADGSVFSTTALNTFWRPAISALHNTIYDMARGAAAGNRPAISGLHHMRDAVAPAMYDMFNTGGTVPSRDILLSLLLRYDTAFWRRIVLMSMVDTAIDILTGEWGVDGGHDMLAALHEIGAQGIAGHPVCERELAAEIAQCGVSGTSELGINILNILGVARVPRSVFADERWGDAPRGLVATRGPVAPRFHTRSHMWFRDGRVGFGRRQPG